MTTIQDATEDYHRALWALDSSGYTARTAQYWLMMRAKHVAMLAAVEGIDGALLGKEIATLQKVSERHILEAEKDRERTRWQKQRDYLLDVVARVCRAAKIARVDVLHYYSASQEDFHAPELGAGYYLWQGLRAELKMGITLADIDGNENHEVLELADRIRVVLQAMELGDHKILPRYEKSELHLSEEQYKKQLWEGVVQELRWMLRDYGHPDAKLYW